MQHNAVFGENTRIQTPIVLPVAVKVGVHLY